MIVIDGIRAGNFWMSLLYSFYQYHNVHKKKMVVVISGSLILEILYVPSSVQAGNEVMSQ